MEGRYNRKVMIANKPIHSHNRGPNQWSLQPFGGKLNSIALSKPTEFSSQLLIVRLTLGHSYYCAVTTHISANLTYVPE